MLKQENGQPKKIKSGKVSCNNTAGIAAVGEALRPYCENVPHFAVVEATYNWYWLANLFESEGWFLRLADPCTVSQANLKYSNDHTDAAYLAERLRVHSLKTFPIMGQAYRDLRDLSRSLMVLKQDMARLKITVVNELVNHCSVRVRIDSLIRDPLKLVRGNEKKPGVYEKLDELLSKIVHEFVQLPGTHYMLCSQLRRIVRLTLEVEKLGEMLFEKMADSPTAQALKTIKGCGPVLSTIIATEVGDIRRFASAKNFSRTAVWPQPPSSPTGRARAWVTPKWERLPELGHDGVGNAHGEIQPRSRGGISAIAGSLRRPARQGHPRSRPRYLVPSSTCCETARSLTSSDASHPERPMRTNRTR